MIILSLQSPEEWHSISSQNVHTCPKDLKPHVSIDLWLPFLEKNISAISESVFIKSGKSLLK